MSIQALTAKMGGMAVGCALLGQPLKGSHTGFLFHNLFLHTLLAPHIKKLKTYFALLYFWTFVQCVLGQKVLPNKSGGTVLKWLG